MAEMYEHVVVAEWVTYEGTKYEKREIVEVRVGSMAEGLQRSLELRRDYSQADTARADGLRLVDAHYRGDPIIEDNSPDLDTVLDAVIFNEVQSI